MKRFRSLWANNWTGSIMIADPAWSTDAYYQLGQRALAGYYRRFSPFNEPVYAIETKIKFYADDSHDYPMTAVLDRLDNAAPGHWVITDYKTGRRVLTPKAAEQDLQMRIYYLSLQQTIEGLERVDAVWQFLRSGQAVSIAPVIWSIPRIQGQIRRRVDTIVAAEAEPDKLLPKETPLCGWCYYWAHCPAKTGQNHPARIAR